MTVRGIQSWHFKTYIISLGLTLMIPLQVFTLHTGCVQEAGMTLCWCEQGSVWSASMCNSLGPCFLHSASAQEKSPCACVRQSPPDSERCLPTTQASSSAGHADPGVRCHGGVPNGALTRKEKGKIADGCGEDSGSGAEEFQGIRRHGEGIVMVGGGREHDVHHADGAAFVGGGKGDGDNKASIVQAERDSVDLVPPRKGHDDVKLSREDRIVPLEGDHVLEAKGEEGEVIRKRRQVLLPVEDRNLDLRDQTDDYDSTDEYETSPMSTSTSSALSSPLSLMTPIGSTNTAGQQTRSSTGQAGPGPSMDSTGMTTATIADDGDSTGEYEDSTVAASTDGDTATAGSTPADLSQLTKSPPTELSPLTASTVNPQWTSHTVYTTADVDPVTDSTTGSNVTSEIVSARPDVSLITKPDVSPVTNPNFSLITTPDVSPVTNPNVSLITTPDVSPVTNPNVSLITRPDVSPVTNPNVSLITTPDVSPVTNPNVSLITTPDVSPVTNPNVSLITKPDVSPVTSPASPITIPGVSSVTTSRVSPITTLGVPSVTNPGITSSTVSPNACKEGSSSIQWRNVKLSDASINEGDNVTLTMAEPEVVPESVMWWNNGTVMVNGIVFTPGFAPGRGPTLTIKGINKNHKGVYSCEACVGTVLVKGNVTLPTILPVPVMDIERSSLPQISVACNESTTLTCCLTSLDENITVTWKKETVQISSVTAKSLCSNYTHPISNPCQDTVYTCTFSNEAGATLYAIQVNYIRANDKTCPSNDAWPETKRNGVAHVRCPPGYGGTALRRCSADGVWGAIFKNCTSKRFTNVEGKVQRMEDGIGNPTELVPRLLAEMKTITQVPEPSGQEPTLLMGDVRSAHASLDKIINVASARDVRFNKSVSKDFLDSASNLLNGSVKESWSQLEFMDSMDSSSLLQTTEDFTHLIDAEDFFSSARTLSEEGSKKSREDFNLSSSNILMAGSLYRARETPTAYHQEFKVDGQTSSVDIDSKAISKLNENSNLTITSMAFTTLMDLLPLRLAPALASEASSGPPSVGSLVLSTVLSGAQGGGSSGISMNLALRGVKAGVPLKETPHCSFWDFKLNGSVGGWSTEGCTTGNTKDNAVSCICTHTTPFSILRLRETSQGDPTFTIITYVCLSISIAFLIFAVVLESMVLHQNKRYGHKSNGEENDDDHGGHRSLSRGIKLNVLCALLLSHVWFMVTISDSNPTVCSLSQFFLHLSYLCAFSWLLLQAIHLLLNGNAIYGGLSGRKVMAATFAGGYGLPVLISVITVAATHSSRAYMQPDSCWLNWDGSKALALVVPVLLVIAVGLAVAIYILLRARLWDHDGQKRQEGGGLLGDSTTGKAWKLLILMTGLAVIWGVGAYFFMPDGNKIPAIMYLFAVLNALQGMIVVVFNCLLDEEVKRLLNRSMNIVSYEGMKKKDSPLVVSEYDIENNTVDGVYRLQRPKQVTCAICGGLPEVSCTECKQPFCRSCDEKQHERLDRRNHERSMNGGQSNVCGICGKPTEVTCDDCEGSFCSECDDKSHRHPERLFHKRSLRSSSNNLMEM
ncbi:adhesion G protein-coupled receptor F5-like isoform X1 [Lethenteron reissneri]|uniref:adhesion G protein-coupled receptor F5-like isoform X1 n=2 Tax=Lethenteron reissneri TaxID=7753 RepID=UPI002AB6BDAA|nr:adhesion G protein-coupled receptor F5-like isoform X1 [Lethenteron reissneri]XP_061436139.1 adhesion G protein-coupled receptor F5-like isoform X1 [Lethenteron reissneri]XP_061436140.1 adhesion G protein-coupled receptor F5-like isoform X1 [Lethenteron reissneri]